MRLIVGKRIFKEKFKKPGLQRKESGINIKRMGIPYSLHSEMSTAAASG